MGVFTALLATSSILLLAWVVGEREKQNQQWYFIFMDNYNC